MPGRSGQDTLWRPRTYAQGSVVFLWRWPVGRRARWSESVGTGIATPPIPSRHGFYLYTPAHHVPSPWHHSAPWVLSGVASVPGKSPADSSLGRPQSSLTRPQHEPSTETLCTPLTCSCLPPPTVRLFLLPRIHLFLDAWLWSPVSLAMEPRLPDLASVSLGEGWGGLLEPLKRERLGSCGFHSHLGLE